ncbi:class I SAM-dependent RNA methyltransferase [Acetobacteraceae bacterium KSS8]|uniref:Class I SAM-dependent RNA methyltransferase n=1 Tax=Endosaccharibacter trunci TaxID=2812733 RepID=A0ABT1W4D1_9PROT|nr:class I SAM-dependent RNA methyltransferase [Acetobacteraceae bacterium KSS8]
MSGTIPASMQAEFRARIDQLGADGDGVCRAEGAPIHVRYALSGETVLAEPIPGRNRAVAIEVIEPSPYRVRPPCSLFGRCGGCVLQHQSSEATLRWKVEQVSAALRTAGFGLPDQIDTAQSAPYTRRRMDLAIRRLHGGALLIGLHERGNETVVDLDECHVLEPALFALLRGLRGVLARVQAVRREGSLLVNALDGGADLLIATDGPLNARDRAILAAFATENAIPRIAWRAEGTQDTPEIISQTAPVSHRFGDATVQPPPGAFLQATASGEAAILAAVLAGLPPKLPRSGRIVELYAGCGTISFALAERARVLALEGHAAALEALRSAAGGRRIETGLRDLNRQPLLAKDFAGVGAIVLDPPHAGAGAQMREIAASGVGHVIYVSCNPAALQRDASQLADSGYVLEKVSVIDQFLWSARIEAVCVFTRKVVVRRGPMPRPNRG